MKTSAKSKAQNWLTQFVAACGPNLFSDVAAQFFQTKQTFRASGFPGNGRGNIGPVIVGTDTRERGQGGRKGSEEEEWKFHGEVG